MLKSLFRFVLRSPSASLHTPQNSLTDYPINSPARHKPKSDTANDVLVSESERETRLTQVPSHFAFDCNSAWHLLWFVTLLKLVKTSSSVIVALIIYMSLEYLEKNEVLYKLVYEWISTKTILRNIIFKFLNIKLNLLSWNFKLLLIFLSFLKIICFNLLFLIIAIINTSL